MALISCARRARSRRRCPRLWTWTSSATVPSGDSERSSAATSAQCCSVQRAPQSTHIGRSVGGLAGRPLLDHALRTSGARARVTLPEIGGDLFEGRPPHPVVAIDVFDQALQHEQDLRSPGDVGVDGDGKDCVVILAVDPIELVAPDLLEVTRVYEAMTVRRLLDEHHRRQVVDVPVGADLDQVRLLAAHEWLHPRLGGLRVVDLRPGVADPRVEGMEVIVHAAVVVGDAILEEERHRGRAQLPPGGHVSGRAPPCKALDEINALVENSLFLLRRHGNRVLMGVPVETDLVPGVSHHLHLPGEGLDRVARDEPGGAETVFIEHLEQPGASDLAGEETARYVARRVLTAIRSQPASHGVHVDAEGAKDLLRHVLLLAGIERPRRSSLSQLVTGRHHITGRHAGQFGIYRPDASRSRSPGDPLIPSPSPYAWGEGSTTRTRQQAPRPAHRERG